MDQPKIKNVNMGHSKSNKIRQNFRTSDNHLLRSDDLN